MSDQLTSDKIYSKVINKELEKNDALKLFESIINNSDSEDIRFVALEYVGKLTFDDKRIFNIIESCLISDESPLVRFEAAKILLQTFPNRENKPLLWAIQNEESIYFLKNLIDLLETYDTSRFKEIREKILKKIELHYNLNSDDSKFVLDIDYLDYMKFKTELYNFLDKFELSDDAKQALIKQNSEIGNKGLGRVKKAEGGFIISLILTDINEIPSSICNLRNLQELEISNCKIEKYPEKCPKLLSLKRIKFKNNTIDKVPSWIRYKN